MEYLGEHDTLHPRLMDNWHCVPEKLARDAIRSDRLTMEKALGL
jgi:hypothetical protein